MEVVRWSMMGHLWSVRSFGCTIRFGFSNPLDLWWRIANLRYCLGCVPSRCSICVYSISSYAAGGYCGLQILGWRGCMQVAQNFAVCSVYFLNSDSRWSMRGRRRPVWVKLYFCFMLAVLRRDVTPLRYKMPSGVFPQFFLSNVSSMCKRHDRVLFSCQFSNLDCHFLQV